MTTSAQEYDTLLLDYRPRPIRTRAHYEKALKQIEALMSASKPTKAESEMVEVLSTLIENYEESRQPAPTSDSVELLEHLIENSGLSKAQLARETGIARSEITNILARRRGISAANAVRLAERFRVTVESFLAAS